MALSHNKTVSHKPAGAVPTKLLLWLTCGTIVAVLFTIIWLIEGAIRHDYSALKHSISSLSLGPGGWVQQVSFVVFGLSMIWMAFAWRKFLKGGVGETWYPIVRCVEGLAIIICGFFNTDPNEGYPKDAVFVSPTFNGMVHSLIGAVSFIAIIVGYFILARRFTRESQWRGWSAYSMITAILTIVFVTVSAVLEIVYDSDFSGLFERIAVINPNTIWGVIFITRLWMGAGFGVFQKKDDVTA
jgi:hypothetical protein